MFTSTRKLLVLAIFLLKSFGAPLNISNIQGVGFSGLDSGNYNSTLSFNSTKMQNPKYLPHKSHENSQQDSFAKYNSTYSFDSSKIHRPDWMTWLPSITNLTSLSIPGTHNSMTHEVNAFYQCQNANLTSQLNSGIRYFDIRARLINNELSVYHNDMPTGYSFTKVLTTLFNFLENNPGEVLLMRLKEEVGLTGEAINSNISFQQAFVSYLTKNSATKHGAAKHFWTPEIVVDLYTVPTVGELRGKILMLQDFGVDTARAEFGINWASPMLAVEDAWNLPEKGGLDVKEAIVEESLMDAIKGTVGDGDGKLYVTYLSGSGGIESLDVAAGKNGINDRAARFIADQETADGALGVVVMDVPGANLIEAILDKNPVGREKSDWTGLHIHPDE